MEFLRFLIFTFHVIVCTSISSHRSVAAGPPCRSTCGSLIVKYPFGTGYGCGSPRFSSHVTCSSDDRLLLATHTGDYPITSISYSASTVIISPPLMSTCSLMHESQTLGIDWTGPFQLGSSAFLLLDCESSSASLTIRGSAVCDLSFSHLCASIYSCPAVVKLGLPLFPPTNSCCVYSPANFNCKGELDLRELKCGGYSSVVSLGQYQTDPMRWEYGVELKYGYGALENSVVENKCNGCEMSGGACGFTPPDNSFVCVCGEKGFNTTTDCNSYDLTQEFFWSSDSFPILSFAIARRRRPLLLLPTIISSFAIAVVVAHKREGKLPRSISGLKEKGRSSETGREGALFSLSSGRQRTTVVDDYDHR